MRNKDDGKLDVTTQKDYISNVIQDTLKERYMTHKKLGDAIGVQRTHISKALRTKSYNIDTLIRILDGLDLEIVIRPREKEVE